MTPDRAALWGELFRSAEEFRQLAPWQWMDDTQVIGVRHPAGDDIGWCVVIGNLGQHFGMVLYPDVAGWRSLRNLHERWPTAEDAAIDQTSLSITFVDHGHLFQPMRRLLTTLQWTCHGKRAWPEALDANGGYIPDILSEEDIPWMIRALRRVGEIARLAKERPELLKPDAQGRLLVSSHVHEEDTWDRHEPPVYVRPVLKPFPFDVARAKTLAVRAQRMPGDWFVDWARPFPMVIEQRGTRPFFPHMLLMLDLPSDYIIACPALPDFEQEFANEVLKQSGDRLPDRFLVRRHDLLVQLSPLAAALGVRVDWQPEMAAVTDTIIARLREGWSEITENPSVIAPIEQPLRPANIILPMPSSAAERLPAYLAVRELFLEQLRLVFSSASGDEISAAAKRLELFSDGKIVLGNTEETDCLVDWIVFQHRRQGHTLSQIAHESRGPSTSADVRAVLAGMATATLGLFRVLVTDPGVGLQVENTWTGQQCFMFEREVSRRVTKGDHLLLRLLTVGDIAFSGAFTMSMPAPLLNAIRQEQATGKLDKMEVISVAGPRQDDFFGSIIAALMRVRRPAPAPVSAPEGIEKIGRNEPCPCGSGKKYKKCCGN